MFATIYGTEHGLLDVIFLFKGVVLLVETGETLKSAREMAGLSLDEVSKDLSIPVLYLEQIEDGSIG